MLCFDTGCLNKAGSRIKEERELEREEKRIEGTAKIDCKRRPFAIISSDKEII